MLRLENVCWKNRRGFSLQNISFSPEKGKVIALMGANGAGKSTLFRLLTGEIVPQRGRVLIDDIPVSKVPRRQFAQRVAVIRQERSFTFPMSCLDLVLTGRTPYLSFMGRTSKADHDMAEDALRRTGTLPLAHAPFEQISGGEKQRVMLARALMQQPDTLLLDEAFSAMDTRQAVRAMRLVRSLAQEKQIAVVCILHDIHIAHAFADRIVILENGCIAADGTPGEVCISSSMKKLTGMNIQVQNKGSLITQILPEEEGI